MNEGSIALKIFVPLLIAVLILLPPLVPTKALLQSPTVSVPLGVLHDVTILVTNSQPSATPSPFQQMVQIDSSAYESFEAPNLQNVEFFSADGSIIPSWLESGATNTSTNTIYWLSLSQGIAASATLTIYMGFGDPSVNFFDGTHVGEAPQLSSVYGQYDNGFKLFDFYDNFAGTSLDTTKWTFNIITGCCGTGTPSYTMNNGFSFTQTGTINFGMASISTSVGTDTSAFEFYGEAASPTNVQSGGGYAQATQGFGLGSAGGDVGETAHVGLGNYLGTTFLIYEPPVSGTTTTYPSCTVSVYTIMRTPTKIYSLFNYGASFSYAVSDSSSYNVGWGMAGTDMCNAQSIAWARVRATPPGGVMPKAVVTNLFTINASPASLTFGANSSGVSIVNIASLDGFAGTVQLSPAANPSGLSCSLNPTSIFLNSGGTGLSTLSCSGSAGVYTVTVTGTSGTVTHETAISVTVEPVIASVSPIIADQSAAIDISGFGFGTNPQTVSLGDGSLDTQTNSVNPSLVVLDNCPTRYSTGPCAAPAWAAGNGNNAIGVYITKWSDTEIILGGFGSALGTNNQKQWNIATGDEISVVIWGPNNSGMAQYNTFVVTPDFTLSVTSRIVLQLGASSASTITLTSVNRFQGSVALMGSSSGPTVSFSPASILVTPAQQSASILTVSTTSITSSGNYSLIVTAASSSLSHQFILQIIVTDFAVSGNPSSLSFESGSSASSTITVTQLEGFTGTITLSTASPAGISCRLDQIAIQSSGTALLTCESSNPGDYSVTIESNSGPASHAAIIPVHVSPIAKAPQIPPATIFGLDPTLFYLIIGIIIALVAVSGIIAISRRRKHINPATGS